MKRLLIIALVLTTLLVAAIALKLREQRAALAAPPGGSGVIEGTDLDLAVQLSARVLDVRVKKGQAVKAGELLVTLDCAEVEASIAEARARVAVARAQQEGAAASTQAARRATGAAYAQAAAARTRGLVVEQRQSAAQRNLSRLEQVGEGITGAALDQGQTEATSLALERQAALESATATTAQASVAEAQKHAASAAEQAAAAALQTAEATLGRVLLSQRECELRAPRAGVIEEVYVEPAEVAARGAALVRLVDLHEVTITFYLPNAELGAVTVGTAARVRADAYPDTTFDGRVGTVSVVAAFTPRNIQTRTDRDRLVYPVEVVLPNPEQKLRPGMPAQVELVRP